MKKTLAIIIIFSLFTAISPVFAYVASSPHYRIQNDSLNIGGTYQTSTNYRMEDTIGEVGTGIATSTSYKLKAGYLTTGYTPKSQNWRWYSDQDNETPAAALANENVAPTNIAAGNVIKLRLTIKETSGYNGTDIKMRLQYSTSSDFSEGVNELTEIADCIGSAIWCYGDGVDNDNDSITTLLLTDSSATSTHNESGISAATYDHLAGTQAEWEFTIKNNGAPTSITYYFRVYDNTNAASVPLHTGETYPSLVTGAGTLTFTVQGIDTGIATEGIITDITTTAVSIPLAELNIGQETEGAQRFTVTTNAENGYQLLAYQGQGLLGNSGEAIDPITATNESPSAWPADPAPGGYGYHTGDDTLSGASPSRFSPDDTYAKFETTMKEVAYSSIPATNESTDLIFKIEVTSQQEAGNYSSEIVYILTPTF